MAQLRNTHLFTLDPAAWRGRHGPVRVGHNRTLDFDTLHTGDHMLVFRLHGNVVGRAYPLPARLDEDAPGRVCIALSDAGWPTVTTARAQEDFLRGLGLDAKVSYARGGFRLFVRDRDREGGELDLRAELRDRPGTYLFEVRDRYSPSNPALDTSASARKSENASKE